MPRIHTEHMITLDQNIFGRNNNLMMECSYQGFLEEFILGIVLPEIQPAVSVQAPAGQHLHDWFMILYGSF